MKAALSGDSSRELRVLISAAEASSDLHGAYLLKELKAESQRRGLTLRVEGIGGAGLKAEGLETVVNARDLLSMGFGEVLVRLPRILRGLRAVTERARVFRPQVAVLIDYPDFHFRLARRLKALAIPTVYYIPPKIWVWRSGRLKFLSESFSKILGILPFEAEVFARSGAQFIYVGNPLLDELPLTSNREEARRRLGIDPDASVIILMPGSRPSEIEMHLSPMLEAALKVQHRTGRTLEVVLPVASTADPQALTAKVKHWQAGQVSGIRVRVLSGESEWAMLAADAGLIKSGTSTLEAAVLGCPHILVYRTSWISAFLFKWLVRYPGPVGLTNLIAAWDPARPGANRQADTPRVVPEILLGDVTAERLALGLERILVDQEVAQAQKRAFAAVRARLSAGGGSPSLRCAREVLEVALGAPQGG